MFISFFLELKAAKVPVSLREYLSLLEALKADIITYDVEGFYYLSRATLVKDERHLDRFDQVFSHVFKGLEGLEGADILSPENLPEEWLRKLAEKHLTEEEKKLIQSLGGFDKLMETLKKRLEEQKERHQGGSKWIGTAGTSPFGAYGYNPEGVRIGQDGSRNRRAVKVWDKREFRNFDDTVELGTRNIKVALKRLRRWVRDGAQEEFDLPGTIQSTAEHGYLDVRTRPERRNAVKLLMFFDVGGSMDDHIRTIEELFSAARSEFKHMEYFYFHNCLYEGVWKDNRRRRAEVTSTMDLLHKYGSDYKVIFVGDASMSPYEIREAGGSVEHWNAEPGWVWLRRAQQQWPHSIWLNPVQEDAWKYTASIGMIRQLFDGRMYPLTLRGLEAATRELSRKS
ncbi:VWA domain-containing protein [Nitratireductor aestuarii]|uniref:VWA domain-containing protein n=1 Tax=Nitratireductor aestuarii TaxID=1735103 RepID=A0A916RNK9_9HYPH|nr:VWA domain-containing protein [Nitratireductor aestuarii]GGA63089.1 VWA domain-containing protein [Nitratireductor aestuarii]